MKNNQTANTCTALTVIDQRTAREAAARARHAVTLPAVIIMTKYTPTPTDADRARRLYAVAHAATAVCLRARSQSEGGEGYVSTVRRQWFNDVQQWERIPEFADRAALHRLTHDQHRAAAEAAQAEADRMTREAYKLTTSEPDRAALLAAAHAHEQTAARAREAAADELAAADAIDKLIEQTAAADREAIVHEAVAGYLIADHSDTESDAFRRACSAAGRAIDATRAAAGYTATRTTLQRMGGEGSTEAENAAAYEAWTKEHPGAQRVPFSVRGGMSSGYYTAEHRDQSKPRKDGSSRRPAGYYLVRHYRTTTTAPLDEAMNLETPTPVHLLDVRHILTAANLTKRDRAALTLLTVATGTARPTSTDPAKLERIRKAAAIVRRAGRQAVEQHDAATAAAVAACDTQRKRQRKQRERDRQREKARAAAMLDAAMTLAGYTTSGEARQKARERLRDRLTAAVKHSQQPQQQTPAAPAPAVTVSRYSSSGAKLYTVTPDTSKPAARHPFPGHLADMTYTSTTTGNVQHVRIVWATKYDPAAARTITEADRRREEQQRRAEDEQHTAARYALDFRRACRDHQPTRTAYAAHDAQTAAAAFLDHLTPAELADVGRAIMEEGRAAAAREERRRAAAKASGLFSLNLSFKQWQALTPEQREAHRAWLNSL